MAKEALERYFEEEKHFEIEGNVIKFVRFNPRSGSKYLKLDENVRKNIDTMVFTADSAMPQRWYEEDYSDGWGHEEDLAQRNKDLDKMWAELEKQIVKIKFLDPPDTELVGKNGVLPAKIFSSFEKLTDIQLPPIREIKNDAFFGCKNLKVIVLPQSIEKLRAFAFENWQGTIIYIGTREQWEKVKNYDSIDEMNKVITWGDKSIDQLIDLGYSFKDLNNYSNQIVDKAKTEREEK